MKIDELIAFYHALSPESVANFPKFYSADAYFKDPFNEVHGIAPIQHIFSHMFKQVGEPRFVVTGKVVDADSAMLIWEFRFRGERWGKVNYHRDYWDTGEELYMKLPVIGTVMRGLKRLLAA